MVSLSTFFDYITHVLKKGMQCKPKNHNKKTNSTSILSSKYKLYAPVDSSQKFGNNVEKMQQKDKQKHNMKWQGKTTSDI